MRRYCEVVGWPRECKVCHLSGLLVQRYSAGPERVSSLTAGMRCRAREE